MKVVPTQQREPILKFDPGDFTVNNERNRLVLDRVGDVCRIITFTGIN